MEHIINNMLDEWVPDKNAEKAKVDIFDNIRDIPYRIDMGQNDPVTGSEKMIVEGHGFCVPKHHLLNTMFNKIGISSRYCTYSFNWGSFNVDWPVELRSMSKKLPLTYHLVSEVYIESGWITLDATWDTGIRSAGFHVNEWNGHDNTILAVDPVDRYVHEDPFERNRFFKEETDKYSFSEKRKLMAFSRAFNDWTEELRCRDRACPVL